MAPALATVSAPSAVTAATTIAPATASAVTAAAATISAATTPAASAARRSSLSRTRFVDGQSAPFYRLPINLGDRVLGVLLRSHRHESEAARFPGEFILHQGDFLHSARLREKLLQFVFRRIEGKITYV